MRFRHPDGSTVHLAYCTNVHPTSDVATLFDQIRSFGVGVRERVGVDRLGIGLWMPAAVAAELAGGDGAVRLRDELTEAGLEVVTLNAFPYGAFHAERVKLDVYSPDWSEPERLAYTLDAAEVLATLLPDDAARGSISTLPFGWRTPWPAERHDRAVAALHELDRGLAAIEDRTGRRIRVGLEPEPGCVVETVEQAVQHVAPVVAASASGRLGVCLDACHLACGFEDPAEAVAAFEAAGLPVVKSQASAALQVPDPGSAPARAALSAYTEDRYLHQVRQGSPGSVQARDDLPEAMTGPQALDGSDPWRVHFHVPLHEQPAAPLASTADALEATLRTLVGGPRPLTDHLEVETYTWTVLPEDRRPQGTDALMDGLAAEMSWVAARLRATGLEQM